MLPIYQTYAGSAPYAASKVPTGQASDELPKSLLAMNQNKSAIYRHVLILDPKRRISACDWLQHLNQWKPKKLVKIQTHYLK
ncbi:hypothetical protein EB796_007916 [Bugula neritina]|uniref:Uncharacterized protein n=1 Tax=Bugula neritina TaxID=10212 RepID=A0A7J7K6D0_BUGNE|nr:hypothetical protein EB796_007916 [Bugula neritina]